MVFLNVIIKIRKILFLFHPFTFSNKNIIERLINSRHRLEKAFSILEHIQVSERNEDQVRSEIGCKGEKSTQVVLSKDRIYWKDAVSSQN